MHNMYGKAQAFPQTVFLQHGFMCIELGKI